MKIAATYLGKNGIYTYVSSIAASARTFYYILLRMFSIKDAKSHEALNDR